MFIRAEGKQYTRFLDNLHRTHLFDWYLEVGCRSGRTFGPVRGKTIAVEGTTVGALMLQRLLLAKVLLQLLLYLL